MDTVLGVALADRVRTSKVLVVGAGGIGCELLKTMALSGFSEVHIIDLDTIDVSNLNRQFLFRKQHVGMSKSEVAREAYLELYPGANVIAYQANIMEERFGPAFYKSFDLILNALDNAEARAFVNRICVALGKSLVESGTGGFAGQVKPIIPGKTECFSCQPVPGGGPVTYPVCTIRNTPDKPVHCIVWAKHLLHSLFGPQQDEDEDHNYLGTMADTIRSQTPGEDHGNELEKWLDIAQGVAKKLFIDDVNDSLKIEQRWEARSPPIPLTQVPTHNRNFDIDDQATPTAEEAATLFINAFVEICTTRFNDVGILTFDKDDEQAMAFVAAASNVRMSIFGIEMQSSFKIKGIAGNIIHAVATTNAIAAGFVVLQAFHILAQTISAKKRNRDDKPINPTYYGTWIRRHGPEVLQHERLEGPSPYCLICSVPTAIIEIDTKNCTLKQFFELVLIGALAIEEPEVSEAEKAFDSEDFSYPVFELPISHPSIGFVDGKVLEVTDFDLNHCRLLVVDQPGQTSMFSFPDGVPELRPDNQRPEPIEDEDTLIDVGGVLDLTQEDLEDDDCIISL